jgi:hypothetical protein
MWQGHQAYGLPGRPTKTVANTPNTTLSCPDLG